MPKYKLPSQIDLAWAAGFFDGEGCVSTLANNPRRVTLSIAQSVDNLEPLDKWYDIFKVGSFVTTYGGRGLERPICNWKCAKIEEVQYVMVLLWPNLSSIKKNRYEEVFKRYLDSKPWVRKKRGPKVYAETWD